MEHNLGCRCAFWVNIDYELPCWWWESTKRLNEWVIRANDFSVVYLDLLRFRMSVTCRVIIQGIRDCSIYMTTVMNNVHLNDLFFFTIIWTNSKIGKYFRVNRTFTEATKLRFFPFKYSTNKWFFYSAHWSQCRDKRQL